MTPWHTVSPIVKGSFFAVLAFFSMAVFGVLTQVASQSGEAIWVSFITYFIASTGSILFIAPLGVNAIKSKQYPYLVARAVIGTLASFLYMLSMHYIPIINSTLLFNTAPIFIPFITVFVLKMRVQKSIWYAVILGFIGIIAIIKPGRDILIDPGNLIGLSSGIALAIAYLIMKRLTATETGLRIIFYYFTIGTLMQIPLLWFTKTFPTLTTCCYAGLSGIMLIIAQLALIKAYRYAAASEVGVYQYSSVVFVAIIEWLIWSNTPDLLDYIGFILVSVAGIFIIFTSGKSFTTRSNDK